MVTVPVVTPVTTPAATVAIAVLLLDQVPPVGVDDSVVVLPMQVLRVPVNEAGVGITVTTLVPKQPEGSVYVIAAVPLAMPVTTPDVLIVAMLGLLLAHTPPAGEQV